MSNANLRAMTIPLKISQEEWDKIFGKKEENQLELDFDNKEKDTAELKEDK